jgi:exodeoxyribonuclease VII large subunit
VTSPTGAALRDILRVIRRRNQALNVLISPARVQGEGASIEIVRALKLLNLRKDVDVIIIGRGGGSIEDLWSFNEEAVARAISGSRVPVISAVGHETDFTIADFVSDLRASTPSAAAELVAAALGDLNERVGRVAGDLVRSIGYKLNASRNLLDELERSRGFEAVRARIDKTSQRLDDALGSLERVLTRRLRGSRSNLERFSARLSEADIARALSARRSVLAGLDSRLRSSARDRLRSRTEQVSIAAGKLNSLSPLAVLGRGYAIAFDADGRVIKRASDVAAGDRLRVRVNEGDIDCIKE